MSTRQTQKQQTRQALMGAALSLLSAERPFTSLGIREITRQAGLSAPSFYRHFDNTEALGLALVEEAGKALRGLLRDARQRVSQQGGAIPTSVHTYVEYLSQHTQEFRLLVTQSNGGSAAFRSAIAEQQADFVAELAEDVRRFAAHRRRPVADADALAHGMISLAFAAGARMLDETPQNRAQSAKLLRTQLRMLQTGAEQLAL